MKSKRKGLRLLGIVLVLVMMLTSIPFFTASAVPIEAVYVYIDAPKIGNTPDYTAEVSRMSNCTVQDINTGDYRNGVCWYEKTSSGIVSIKPTDKFEAGKVYMVRVELKANNDPFMVSGSRIDIDAYVNGNDAYNADGYDPYEIWVDYYFPMCKEAISTVELTVVTPVAGKTPTFAKVNADKYYSENYTGVSNQSNGVTWTNQSSGINITVSNPFKEGSKYTVTYYLTAKNGYYFANTTAFTINGKTATATSVAKDSDGKDIKVKVSLKDIVPDDGKTELSTLNLSVTAPKDGNKPSYTKIDGTGYYSDNGLNGSSTKIYKNGIAWYKTATSYIGPGTTETFKGGSSYTVKISVLPEDGYKFAKNITAKINGKTATVEHFDDGSVTVSVTLTAPKVHTHTESGWKTDGTHHWKVCTDPTCGVITTAKTAHSGGKATCTEKAKCSICGAEYGATTAHIAGPAPTETTPQTCTKCGFVIKPALNHTHKLSKVSAKEATCTESGNKEYYACSGCPELFSDANGTSKIADSNSVVIAPKGHAGGDWKSDENLHWQECTTCGEVLDETKMLHEDTDEDGKCDTCSYEQGTTEEPTTKPTEPSSSNTSTTTNNGGDDDGAPISVLTWVIIGAGFVVLLAALIVVIILLAKKKK